MNARHLLFCLYIASVAMSALTAADVSSILWLVSVASARTVIRVSAFTAERCFVEGKKQKVCALESKVFNAVQVCASTKKDALRFCAYCK